MSEQLCKCLKDSFCFLKFMTKKKKKKVRNKKIFHQGSVTLDHQGQMLGGPHKVSFQLACYTHGYFSSICRSLNDTEFIFFSK